MKGDEKLQNPLEYGSKVDLKVKLEKGFESWKNNVLEKTVFYLLKNSEDDSGIWGEAEIDDAELSRCVLESQSIFSSDKELGITRTFLNEESKPKLETDPEITQESDSKRILNNSTVNSEEERSRATPQTPEIPHSPQTIESHRPQEAKTGESGDNPQQPAGPEAKQEHTKDGECGLEGKCDVSLEDLASRDNLTLDNLLATLSYEHNQKGVNQVIAVEPLEPTIRGTCPLCRKHQVLLVWQPQFLGNLRIDACCRDCGGQVKELAVKLGVVL
jgi:hypothetical protein